MIKHDTKSTRCACRKEAEGSGKQRDPEGDWERNDRPASQRLVRLVTVATVKGPAEQDGEAVSGWPCLRATEAGVLLELAIQPRAGGNGIVGLHDGVLKVRLTAPPVEGAANKACIQLLAKTFGVPKSRITLLKGAKARRKTVFLAQLARADAERILDHLNLER